MCPEDLFAGVRDLHRGFSLARRHCTNDFQRNNLALAAKAAADQRLNNANLRHRHLQHDGQFVLEVIRNLRGGPDRQPSRLSSLGIELEAGERGVRLHRRMCDFIGEITAFEDAVCVPKSLLGITKNVVIILLDVVGFLRMDQIRSRLHRLFRIEVCRQRLVVNVNQFHCLLGNRF